jgi:bacterioferritin-associated ferredoxin
MELAPQGDSTTVYVCICNALTDDAIRQAASRDGATRPAEVFAACRCRAQCGTCVRSLRVLLGFAQKDGHDDGFPAAGDAMPAPAA